jgi:hypothetical protein
LEDAANGKIERRWFDVIVTRIGHEVAQGRLF